MILCYGDAIDYRILWPGPHVLRLLQALNKRLQPLPLDLLAIRHQISNIERTFVHRARHFSRIEVLGHSVTYRESD